jgi:biotin carboxyl carrier protein
MNTLVSSTASGSVVSINVGAGDMVEEGQALLTIG